MEVPRQYKSVSCAECKRQKLRCDRVFPCASCKKRGCADICPDGRLPPQRAKRSDKIVEPLIKRIRALEHALETIQASHSDRPHPLLSKELREVPDKLQDVSTDKLAAVIEATSVVTDAAAKSQEDTSASDLSENLGTLSLEGYGKSRFFGTSGNAFHVLRKSDDISSELCAVDVEHCLLGIPQEIMDISCAFIPTSTHSSSLMIEWIEANLPPYLEAWSLCETFFENGAYIFIPLRRSPFIEEIFSFFYRGKREDNVEIPRGHRLALLLMIFALGEMLDLTKPAMPTGGKKFYYLARATLALEPLYDQPTLTAVQAITLMMMYLLCSDHKDADEIAYVYIKWDKYEARIRNRELRKFRSSELPTEERSVKPQVTEEELRRVLFHEVIQFEGWLALRSGRPSIIRLSQFDCEAPGVYTKRDNIMEKRHMEGQAWGYGFLRSCLFPVLDYAVNVKPPGYSDVLKLDQTIRTYNLPAHIQVPYYEEQGPNATGTLSRAAIMERFAEFSMREILLLYLHRPYFATAMIHYSSDPLHCPFARSVFSSFSAACGISIKINQLFEKEPLLSIRIWIFWDQLFVPCIFGTLVIRSPGCKLSPIALHELDKITDLLEKAKDGLRASTLLPHALKLRDKAHAVYNLYYSSAGIMQPSEIDITKELIALIGKSQTSPAPSSHSSPASQLVQRAGTPLASADMFHSSQSNSSPDISLPTETGIYFPINSALQDNWNVLPVSEQTVGQSFVPHIAPDIHAIGTEVDMADIQSWQNDIEAILSQPVDSSMPSVGNAPQDPYWGTDVQLTWQGFMAEMLQAPDS